MSETKCNTSQSFPAARLEQLEALVALLRPRDGQVDCLETDVVCLEHGANSLARPNDLILTRAEAIELAEGEGMSCNYCGAVIVELGVPITPDVLALVDRGQS